MRSYAALLLILSLLAVDGCGRKQFPQPPKIRLADQTRDLKVLQRDDVAVLEWSYPSSATDGSPLSDIEKVELWRVVLPRGQEPAGSSIRDQKVKVQLIEAQGVIIVELDTEGLANATRGPKLHIEDDLKQVRSERPDLEHNVIWYAVRTLCCKHKPSAYSNIARLVVELPPKPPASFTAVGSLEGILLSWGEDFEFPIQVERSPDGETWTTVSAEPIQESVWLDTSPAQGQTWHYQLRSVREGSVGVPIIGEPSPRVIIDHADVYPPETPRDLVCLPEGSQVRLRWGAAPPEIHFQIERKVNPGIFETLTTDIKTNEYIDAAPPFGALVYQVRALDPAGNLSQPMSCETLIGATP